MMSDPLFNLSPEQLRETLEEVRARAVVDVGTAAAEHSASRTALEAAVNAARAAGASWTEIGKAAGMSRQAARERWSR
jgi:hypothetical protein